jgi:hypothetical protein
MRKVDLTSTSAYLPDLTLQWLRLAKASAGGWWRLDQLTRRMHTQVSYIYALHTGHRAQLRLAT